MHINDVYATRSLLNDVRNGLEVDQRLLVACLEALNEEVQEFEMRLHEVALQEEAQQ